MQSWALPVPRHPLWPSLALSRGDITQKTLNDASRELGVKFFSQWELSPRSEGMEPLPVGDTTRPACRPPSELSPSLRTRGSSEEAPRGLTAPSPEPAQRPAPFSVSPRGANAQTGAPHGRCTGCRAPLGP